MFVGANFQLVRKVITSLWVGLPKIGARPKPIPRIVAVLEWRPIEQSAAYALVTTVITQHQAARERVHASLLFLRREPDLTL